MLSGYAIYFSLPRLMSAAEFGNYGVTIGFLSSFNMMLVVGTIQSVSRYIAETPALKTPIHRAALRAQTILGGFTAIVLFAGADGFASLFHDPGLSLLIRIGAICPLLYALYAIAIGSLNGRRLYHRQATLDVIFAVIKTVLIIAGAWIAGSVAGAMAGFTVTAFATMIIGMIQLKREGSAPANRSVADGPEAAFPISKLLHFELSVIILTLLSNVLINIDLFMVKAIAPAASSAALSGYYTAVQTFARIPYILVVALALVVFPLISKSAFAKDLVRCRRYIRGAFRFPLVMIAPAALFISTYAAECLHLVYPEPYRIAAPALGLLALAEIVLSLFYLATVVMNGSGRPGISILAAGTGIAVHFCVSFMLIPRHGLTGAAIASLSGWCAGFAVCAVYLLKRFHVLVSPLTVIRTLIAMAATGLIMRQLPIPDPLFLVVGFPVTVTVYWGLLWVFREISLRELRDTIARIRQ